MNERLFQCDCIKEINELITMEILLHSSQDALLLLEQEGDRYLYRLNNLCHQDLSGLTIEEIRGKSPREVLGERTGKIQEDKCNECIAQNTTILFEDTIYLKGVPRRLLNKFTPYTDVHGKHFVIVSRVDITHLHIEREEKDLQIAKFNAMFRHHTAIMLLINPHNGTIVDANPSASEFYGYSIEELKAMRIDEINTLSVEEIKELRQKALAKSQKYFLFPHRLKSGEIRYVDVYSSPIEYGDQEVLYSIIFDVTEREESKQLLLEEKDAILYLSHHDSLTGIYNRRRFEEIWKEVVINKQYPIGIVMGDVNGLKITNDAFGHRYGDELLTVISEHIRAALDENDTAFRWGGDEFVILLPGGSDASVKDVIWRIQKSLKDVLIRGLIQASISFGYSIDEDGEKHVEYYIREAEERMYKIKTVDGRIFRNELVDRILNWMDTSDIEKKAHGERVAAYCKQIALRMNLHDEHIQELVKLARFHDIGKSGIPSNILLQTGALSQSDWEEVHKHPEIGYRILNSIPDINNVAEYILHHHEWWNGKGYPKGLQGREIPLCCRILAVADAYDTMCHTQVYKPAKTPQECIQELQRVSGEQFDPEIVQLFVDYLFEHETVLG